MTDRQSTHGHDCWGWGPKHYECAVAEVERLQMELEHEEQRVADMMADVNRVGHEIDRLQTEMQELYKALKDIRSLSSINFAMNPNPLALTVLLADIHHIADSVLAREGKQ